jgi:hypothetical protein
MDSPKGTALGRILALGRKASRCSEADLARLVGVSRERIRQLKVRLPHKPINTRESSVPGYDCRVERAFYTAMRLGIDKLVALVDVRGDDECWPWLGYRCNGYAVLGPGRRYVHRLIYEREIGPIPERMLVVHKLDGRPCCNPRHLTLSTERERPWRALRDGSRVNVTDEMRSLTPAKVRAIRRAYARLPKVKSHRDGRTFERVPLGCAKALARRFGLKNRKRLAHIATGKSGSWILRGDPGR